MGFFSFILSVSIRGFCFFLVDQIQRVQEFRVQNYLKFFQDFLVYYCFLYWFFQIYCGLIFSIDNFFGLFEGVVLGIFDCCSCLIFIFYVQIWETSFIVQDYYFKEMRMFKVSFILNLIWKLVRLRI